LLLYLPLSNTNIGHGYYWILRAGTHLSEAPLSLFLGPVPLIALFLLLRRLKPGETTAPQRWFPFTLPLLLCVAAATASSLVNYWTENVVETYIGGYFSAGLLFLAVLRYDWTRKDLDVLFFTLSLGSLIPMLSGLATYIAEWGIPDAETIVNARVTMSLFYLDGYYDATFGNIQNTANFIVLVSPPLLALCLDHTRHPLLRGWFAIPLIFLVLNLLFIQARTGMTIFSLVALMLGAPAYVRFLCRKPLLGIILTVVLVAILVRLCNVVSEAFKLNERGDAVAVLYFTQALTLDSDNDASVGDRFDAMAEGWRLFMDNWPFGIGPNARTSRHSHASAHQFNIEQGMELGVVGFLGSSLIMLAVFICFIRATVARINGTPCSDYFILLLGPAAYMVYAVLASVALNVAYVNVWICVFAVFLALAQSSRSLQLPVGFTPPCTLN
jgi:hypothetical protein